MSTKPQSSEGPRLGVGGVVISDGKLLMVQRGKEPGAGLWTVPGGHLEAGELLVDAVAREVREETGLDVQVGELLGLLEVVGDGHHYVILDYLALPTGDAEPVAAGDAAAAEWVPFEEIRTRDCTPRFVETLQGWGVLPE